jgi:hypothetical protein
MPTGQPPFKKNDARKERKAVIIAVINKKTGMSHHMLFRSDYWNHK